MMDGREAKLVSEKRQALLDRANLYFSTRRAHISGLHAN